jgi:nucleoid DNA-binding protein
MVKINKRDFWVFLRKEIGKSINSLHIYSVISILCEEMVKDLIVGKEIEITNFGTFSLKRTTPQRFMNVVSKEIETSTERNKLELTLTPKLNKYISKHIDEELRHEYDDTNDNRE